MKFPCLLLTNTVFFNYTLKMMIVGCWVLLGTFYNRKSFTFILNIKSKDYILVFILYLVYILILFVC